jgi:transposase
MRGSDERSGELFSYIDLEKRVRPDHPLRVIRTQVNEALARMERDLAALYSPIGRPSVPPGKLLLLDPLGAATDGAAGVRSPVPLVRGIGVEEAAWDHSSFSSNRDRLLKGNIAAKFLGAVLSQPRVKRLLSSDHFSVDGTLIEAWASMKKFKPPDGATICAATAREVLKQVFVEVR